MRAFSLIALIAAATSVPEDYEPGPSVKSDEPGDGGGDPVPSSPPKTQRHVEVEEPETPAVFARMRQGKFRVDEATWSTSDVDAYVKQHGPLPAPLEGTSFFRRESFTSNDPRPDEVLLKPLGPLVKMTKLVTE